jgi:hypothetical protein
MPCPNAMLGNIFVRSGEAVGVIGKAARSGFQRGQTAKAREGPPCAVTPE